MRDTRGRRASSRHEGRASSVQYPCQLAFPGHYWRLTGDSDELWREWSPQTLGRPEKNWPASWLRAVHEEEIASAQPPGSCHAFFTCLHLAVYPIVLA